MTLPVDTVISAGHLVTGAFGGDSLSEHSKLCGREFTADCSMFNTKHDVSLMWLIAASSSLHVCGTRGEMLSGPVGRLKAVSAVLKLWLCPVALHSVLTLSV